MKKKTSIYLILSGQNMKHLMLYGRKSHELRSHMNINCRGDFFIAKICLGSFSNQARKNLKKEGKTGRKEKREREGKKKSEKRLKGN